MSLIEPNTIHCCDCMDGFRRTAEESVDVVLTDPPYCSGSVGEAQRSSAKNQGIRSDTLNRFKWFVGDNMSTQGYTYLMREVGVNARRVLKPTGHLLVFTDWRMVPTLEPAIESAGFRYRNLIVWDKGSFGMGRGFRMQHEIILHFTAGAPEYFSASSGNVLKVSRVQSDKRRHPTEKPIELIKKLLAVVAEPGQIVLDPFLGSGTTIEACLDMGLNYIGYEIDTDYFAAIEKRVYEFTRQTSLFDSGQ